MWGRQQPWGQPACILPRSASQGAVRAGGDAPVPAGTAADAEQARPVGKDGFWQRAGSKTGQHAACSSSPPRSSNTWGCDPGAAPAAHGAPPGGEQEPVPALGALLQPAQGVVGDGSTLATVPLTVFNGKEGWPALPAPPVLVVPSEGAAGLILGCIPGFQCLWAGCFCRSSSLRHCLPASCWVWRRGSGWICLEFQCAAGVERCRSCPGEALCTRGWWPGPRLTILCVPGPGELPSCRLRAWAAKMGHGGLQAPRGAGFGSEGCRAPGAGMEPGQEWSLPFLKSLRLHGRFPEPPEPNLPWVVLKETCLAWWLFAFQ